MIREWLVVTADVIKIFAILCKAETRETGFRFFEVELDEVIIGNRVAFDRKLDAVRPGIGERKIFQASSPAVVHPGQLAEHAFVTTDADPPNRRGGGELK